MNRREIIDLLNSDSLPEHREEPFLSHNFGLVDNIMRDLAEIDMDKHAINRKGLLKLLSILRSTTLECIPSNVFRNALGPLVSYLSISFAIQDGEEREEIFDIFYREYEKTISFLNFYINLAR